jgi:catechol 2,3-dioxygenase-like lactoylglutathione lyase family enzyme
MSNLSLDFVLLFVESPAISKNFYASLLGLEPIEESETFVLFSLPNNIQLGLWSRHSAEPKVFAQTGASEIAFTHKNGAEIYKKWCDQNIQMLQHPTNMSFGRTFVALDPDGHRLRVFWPNEETC